MGSIWKIAAGVFLGIVATALFFGFISDCSKSSPAQEKWTACLVTVKRPLLFKKSGIQLSEGQIYEGKVSQDTGEVILLLGDNEFRPPQDAVEIRQKR